MMEKPKMSEDLQDPLEDNAVVSATDRTGLQQTPPLDDTEEEGFCELYDLPPIPLIPPD